MARPVHVFLLPLTVAAFALVGRPETPATLSASPDQSSAATGTAPAKPKRERLISDGLASSLAASLPKYNPPPKPNPEDEDIDLREVDKPKNGIIRLPKYTVREKKPPVFRERDIYSKGGLADVAKRRYLTTAYNALNRFYLPIPFFSSSKSPEEHALEMYAEDERLQNIADLNDTAQTIGRVDPSEGTYIKRAATETYMRSSGFGYEPKNKP